MKSLFILLLALPVFSFAQSKVGHVNTLTVLGSMPEVKIANTKLDSINNVYQTAMKALEDEYNKLLEKKDTQAIKQQIDRIQAFEQMAKSDFQKQSDELMTPIHKKLSEAIKAVSTEGKYTIVFDYSQEGIIVYVSEGDDITDAVKKKLGLK